jgi:5-formyltetrahydrofolate cyclo-ligase
MSKTQIRNDTLLMRHSYASALWPSTRASLETQLAEIALPHLMGAGVVAGYHPMRDEISPYPLLERLDRGQRAVVPWFADRDARMIFREVPATEAGPWNVLQPPPEAEALIPDIVLVPLVAADRHGTRIGHGKGHYDRALSHLRESGHAVQTIGLAWELQIMGDPIAPDPWDQPLHAIVTPQEWIQCR